MVISMMEVGLGQMIVRRLDDAVVAALKAKAARRGHSLEQELRNILTAAAAPTRAEMLAELDRCRALTPPGERRLAEDLVRRDRDRR